MKSNKRSLRLLELLFCLLVCLSVLTVNRNYTVLSLIFILMGCIPAFRKRPVLQYVFIFTVAGLSLQAIDKLYLDALIPFFGQFSKTISVQSIIVVTTIIILLKEELSPPDFLQFYAAFNHFVLTITLIVFLTAIVVAALLFLDTTHHTSNLSLINQLLQYSALAFSVFYYQSKKTAGSLARSKAPSHESNITLY
jgi:hypothetical protein